MMSLTNLSHQISLNKNQSHGNLKIHIAIPHNFFQGRKKFESSTFRIPPVFSLCWNLFIRTV